MTPARRRTLTIAGPLAIVAIGVAAWLYATEWVEIRENAGYTKEAMTNPFLAANLFLERMDVQVESTLGLKLLDDLPPVSDTLLVASSWRALSERRVAALVEWVEQGGHLIMPGTTTWNALRGTSGDPLLDYLEVQVHDSAEFTDELAPRENQRNAREELIEKAQANIDAKPTCGPAEDLVQLQFAEDEDDAVAVFSSHRTLVDAGARASRAASNQYGTQLLQFEIGDGLITVMTTLNHWRNRIVDCHDHAHLLRLLVGSSEKLWWLYDTELPALPVLIWRNAAPFVLGLLVLIVLIAWREGFRFGPRVARDAEPRRQLMEHIDGIARFFWQHRSSDKLLDALRDEVMSMHHVRADQRSNDLAASLAALTGVAEDEVRWALGARTEHNDTSFSRAVSILQRVRKAL